MRAILLSKKNNQVSDSVISRETKFLWIGSLCFFQCPCILQGAEKRRWPLPSIPAADIPQLWSHFCWHLNCTLLLHNPPCGKAVMCNNQFLRPIQVFVSFKHNWKLVSKRTAGKNQKKFSSWYLGIDDSLTCTHVKKCHEILSSIICNFFFYTSQ